MKGDTIKDKDAFQAAAFDEALKGCDVVVRICVRVTRGRKDTRTPTSVSDSRKAVGTFSLARASADIYASFYVRPLNVFLYGLFRAPPSPCQVIPAGVPRKPGMTRQDLFQVNATLNANFADAVAKNCPKALVAIISNPVNSTVPIFAEQMKKHGCYDARRVFGVTTLDIVRAHTFVAEAAGVDVMSIKIPVVGGHAGASILPLLSQATPAGLKARLTKEQVEALTHRIQNGGTEVVNAKAGAGSATLSMAKAGANFTASLIKGLQGKPNVVECAYVESDVVKECKWFATRVTLGPQGIVENHGLGALDEYETKKLGEAVKELVPSIVEGVDFVAAKK